MRLLVLGYCDNCARKENWRCRGKRSDVSRIDSLAAAPAFEVRAHGMAVFSMLAFICHTLPRAGSDEACELAGVTCARLMYVYVQ